ncbi:hypothetical protein HPP92_022723 [Vanilla planifolia]|uniref:RRM domain-containing protein n=1 Tax=Vanilla planifolia TaxID=51239 RepID=A0A835UFY3_VANPL|nr:hypothetical protein HPP92_023018 [Vanilla planifolia]KAG0459595.1 hypothetical protein HPP92_022723 [Vanilla planifolia]
MAIPYRGAPVWWNRLRYRCPLVGSWNPSFLPSQLVVSRGIASKLFVGGLSFYTSEQSLSDAFSKFGQVVEATIVMDRVSDRSKGFGFVTFASEMEAQKALEEMNGKALNGRVIFVEIAKAKKTNFAPVLISRGPPDSESSK